ncbi:hypothetical protein ALC62_07011 [Cyphomyrmex costatus]|uniref:Uncharacterized protein n=1 Tax=Cyphomyrmex costatus TaxID=456900 RepID=A0A195CP17_9HYME|nr:hypothetical protein ALC62_07011 [Cyphomyrmex costatus]
MKFPSRYSYRRNINGTAFLSRKRGGAVRRSVTEWQKHGRKAEFRCEPESGDNLSRDYHRRPTAREIIRIIYVCHANGIFNVTKAREIGTFVISSRAATYGTDETWAGKILRNVSGARGVTRSEETWNGDERAE